MKKIMYLFLTTVCSAGNAQAQQDIDSTWFRNHYEKIEVSVPMRDGVKLFTSIYAPKDASERHPILMTRTPYSCAPYGPDNFRTYYAGYYRAYLKEGYIMVTQDVRGRWMSEGTFEDVRPYREDKTDGKTIDEASDTYDTVDWLVKNVKGNNGKVGVFGISYPGFYSTMAALSRHPALVAVSPQAPVTDWFLGDDFHHNGAFFVQDAFSFYTGFGQPRPKPTTVGPTAFRYRTNDNYDFYLQEGALPHLTTLMGDSIKFWQDVMNHPNYDQWWQARNVRNHTENILPTTHTLVVGGLFDAEDCFGAWNTYKAIEKKAKNDNRIVVGPWFHGQWAGRGGDGEFLGNVQYGSKTARWYFDSIELPYFNYYLKGKGSIDNIREANIFFTGENEWHSFDRWPPAGSKETAIYLQADGGLSFNAPTNTANAFTQYTSDPSKPVPYTDGIQSHRTREYMTDDQRFAARRPDVVVFQTGILDKDMTLAGPLTADLQVSTNTTDVDFVVKLIDVFPDDFQYANDKTGYVMNGYQMLVRGDIFRGRFRNSFEKPEPFIPGKVTEVKYTMPDIAHTFKKGHRIMVQIQSTWFPLVDRNPQKFVDIYHAKDSDFQKADIRIYHAKGHGSKLVLPVLE